MTSNSNDEKKTTSEVIEHELAPDVEQGVNQNHEAKASPGHPRPGQLPRSQTTALREKTDELPGWQVWILRFGLWTSLFLSTLETTIVSTSLVSITNALDGFMSRDWIVTSYLLTYTGFLTISAKMSDVFGRKTIMLMALGIYTIASVLCGIANNITTLIVFRAFQGMGASGIYAMIFLIAPGLVPTDKYNKAMVMIQTVTIVASTLGPVLGGVINANTTWRWVFLLNIPGGVVAFAVIAVFLPRAKEYLGMSMKERLKKTFHASALAKIDVFGSVLLLASTILLIFSLQEGGTRFEWNSAPIITTLILAFVLFGAFIGWELWLDPDRESRDKETPQEPLFAPTVAKQRLMSAILATTFCVGFPVVAIIINIPQRAQAVSGLSPIKAGLTLLPMMLTSPLSAGLSSYLMSGMELPPFYLIMGSSGLQLLGVGLMCSLPTHTMEVPKAQYGFEILMGLGFGLMVPTLMKFAKVVVTTSRSTAGLTGAMIQVRVIAGTISVAICSTILNNYLEDRLPNVISPSDAKMVLKSYKSIAKLDAQDQEEVRLMFAEGYSKQYIFLTALTALGFVASLFIWERKPRKATKKVNAVETMDGGAGV